MLSVTSPPLESLSSRRKHHWREYFSKEEIKAGGEISNRGTREQIHESEEETNEEVQIENYLPFCAPVLKKKENRKKQERTPLKAAKNDLSLRGSMALS